MRSWVVRCVSVGWPLLLSVLLLWPLWSSTGYPLARDAVFVPRQPWTPMVWGGGQVAPRAVPLDAVMAVLTRFVDGAVWARVLVTGALTLAGWGAARCLVRVVGPGASAKTILPGMLLASGLAVWNPWVAERLALGQWALVIGYAALPCLTLAVLDWAEADGFPVRTAAAVLGWTAVTSVTPTGGLLALAVAAVVGLGRTVRSWFPVLTAAAMQLPWVLAGFMGQAVLVSDPEGVEAFAARSDGTGSAFLALLGLGGIWDRSSTPHTRETGWAWLSVTLVVAVVAGSLWAWRTGRLGRSLARRCALLGAASYVLAAASSTPSGAAAVRWVVLHVPGGGLLRDSQKFLAPAVVLVVVLTGWAAVGLARRLSERGVSVWPVALVPFLLVPDATTVVWPTWRPVHYPAVFSEVADVVARTPDCRMLTLPLRSYRGFSWGSGLSSSDPAVRWFDCEVLTDDRLQVGNVVLDGESRELAAVAGALETGEPAADVARRHGIRWLLVYTDDPLAAELPLDGATVLVRGPDIALYSVP